MKNTQVRNWGPMVEKRQRLAREGRIAKARAVLEEYGYQVIEPAEDDAVKAAADDAA